MSNWLRVPTLQDPRPYAASLQLSFLVIGMYLLGFNRTWGQVLFIVGACIVLDFILHFVIHRKLLFPFSALQTGLSLAILTSFGLGLWLALVPVFLSILSKYVVTYKGRHIFNPSLFGLAATIYFMGDLIAVSPAKQWDGSVGVLVYILAGAIIFVMPKIKRTALVLSLLGFFGLQVLARAYWLTPEIPLETIFYGLFFSPAFYLFVFFFLTDPATTPNDPKKQVAMTAAIVLIDTLFHAFQILSSVFYAGFIYFALRWLWLVANDALKEPDLKHRLKRLALPVAGPVVAMAVLVGLSYGVHEAAKAHLPTVQANFKLERMYVGIEGRKGDTLDQIDPRAKHIAKWLLAAGEGVNVVDVNNDGLLDVFFTQTQKRGADRVQLYIAKAPFVYEQFALPQLQRYRENEKQNGVPAGAMFFDADNDGDKDLLILALSGKPMFLQNMLTETGELGFTEAPLPGDAAGHQNAVAVTAADFDNNGYLDVVWSNYFPKYHEAYPGAQRLLNIFNLPEAEYEGDNRPQHILYNSWANATNGGLSRYMAGGAGGFEDVGDPFNRTTWTLALGAADLNNDGLQDIYFANDNGPDDMFMQKASGKFIRLIGLNRSGVGRDTYKGMNVSFADFDKNGMPDIYVSNMHEPTLVEGSMLWLNNTKEGEFNGNAFTNSASSKGTWNEKRFGWGAGVGDLNLDGQPDIVQANGMIDTNYDSPLLCTSYWYASGLLTGAVSQVLPYADKWPSMVDKCMFAGEKNRVYLNEGGYFADVADEVGFATPNTARAIALADLDNDGDLDVIVAHPTAAPSFYKNTRNEPMGDWLGVKLVGNGQTCNSDAVGTRVHLTYGGADPVTLEQRVYATQGMSAQGDQRLLFGLNGYSGMVKLKVDWCGQGADVTTAQVASGRYTTLKQ